MVGREIGNNLSDDDLPSCSSEEEEDNEFDEEAHFQEDANKISSKHIKHTDMEEREKEDMDFPDEVETPLVNARERFSKYRGIKSLRNCDWDPYENLPEDYAKVWRFQSYQAAHKDSVIQATEEGLPLNGTYVTIVLEVPSDIDAASYFTLNQKLIASTLFPNECKLSVMHFKIKRTVENKTPVPSKTLMEFHCGFRRVTIKPAFGIETNPGAATEKYKYSRYLRDDGPLVASAICPIIFDPCKVMCFTPESIK